MSVEKFRHEAKRWLLQAEADIKAAEASAKAGSFEWACFQAQQAGEKALKAIWQFHALEPWGHSLTRLIEEFPDESGGEAVKEYLVIFEWTREQLLGICPGPSWGRNHWKDSRRNREEYPRGHLSVPGYSARGRQASS